MGIFKAYDIRGVYPSEFDEQKAAQIARAFIAKFKPKNVVVGRDMRPHSVPLTKAFINALIEQGAHVYDIGLTTTPMMYFTTASGGYDTGVMITASHNPPQYNGVKMVRKGGVPIGGPTGIYDIENMMGKTFKPAKSKGEVKSVADAKKAYVARELSFVDASKIKPYKVAIDTGNGMGGFVAGDVFAQTKCKVFPLFFELDGTFPNHEANPVKDETLIALKKEIKKRKADVGVALDGDCDRIFLLDEKGERVSADLLGAALLPAILKRYPKGLVLANVTCSWVIKEEVQRLGGKFKECPVGHSLIKAQMRKEKAVFAVEFSGHFFLQENYYLETPFAVALMALQRMSEEGKTLSQLIAPYRRYFSTGEVNFEVVDKDKTLKLIEKEMKKGAKRVSKLDGLKIEFEDFWFNVRPSNTEPLLRLNLEAKSKTRMDEMQAKLTELIKR